MGSEMCIRDRPDDSPFLLLKPRSRLIPACARDFAEQPFYSVDKPCLLYTSDAADERSSVDLGGRRIIKKKHLLNKIGIRHSTMSTKTRTQKYGQYMKSIIRKYGQ